MICKICKKRKGMLDYSESVLNYTHGFVRKICRQCHIEIMQKTIRNCKEGIKKQKELIKNE